MESRTGCFVHMKGRTEFFVHMKVRTGCFVHMESRTGCFVHMKGRTEYLDHGSKCICVGSFFVLLVPRAVEPTNKEPVWWNVGGVGAMRGSWCWRPKREDGRKELSGVCNLNKDYPVYLDSSGPFRICLLPFVKSVLAPLAFPGNGPPRRLTSLLWASPRKLRR
ncbi:hypothetical protein NDU88_009334 [Pleurodeles waltl]|uniref:Uncharacterized protein n=1 Tax=Pleurodeles waltl TaxID=8319 RepID=A0AAV7RVU2_PLEWA|nr:hypothetical protein NDU88_009334 [Pleurodeles waltl]